MAVLEAEARTVGRKEPGFEPPFVDFGGAATDLVPFSCTLRVNGLPTVTPA